MACKIITRINIQHDYFNDGICPDVMLIPDDKTKWIFYRMQMTFKEIGPNSWAIIASEDTDISSPWEEEIEFRIKVTNPLFWYYTTPGEGNDGTKLDTIRMTLTEQILSEGIKGSPASKTVSFTSPKVFWKYTFIPIVEGNRAEKIKFIDQSAHQLRFDREQEITIDGKRGDVFISAEAVRIKESYGYRFELYDERAHGEKLLRKLIPFPAIDSCEPGRKGEKIKILNRYIYY